MREILKKKNCEEEIFQLGNFHFFFFNLSKIHSTEFFLIFLVSSSVCVTKRFLSKHYGVAGLVFKINAIDGKKWIKFVAMQQDRAILIYDFNTIKGTGESYFKIIAQPFKTEQFQALTIRPSSITLKKQTGTCFEPP